MQQLSLPDLDKLCRLCATPRPLLSLHALDNVVHKIEMCLPIKINPDDRLSTVICDNCLQLLDQFVAFIRTSIKAEGIQKRVVEMRKTSGYNCDRDELKATPQSGLLSEPGSKTKPGPRKSYNCEHCSKEFRCSQRIQFHMRAHNNGTDLGVCLSCGKEFPTELLNYKHFLYNHTKRTLCSCVTCGKQFSNKSSLRYHQRCHTSLEAMRPFSCDVCNKRFARKNTLRDHLQSQHQTTSDVYECGECREVFPSSDTIDGHLIIHHGDTSVLTNTLTLSKLYVCEYCNRYFAQDEVLMRHKLYHGPPHRFQCKICNQEFESYGGMTAHLETHALDGFTTKFDFRAPNFYLCDFCEAGFQAYQCFREHFDTHQDGLPYKCKCCALAFVSLGEAVDHRATHLPTSDPSQLSCAKVLSCQFCCKTFNAPSALMKHIRIHTKEKPYRCKECGKQFTQSSGLSTHTKVHSASRPYECDICGRKFKIIGEYKQHVRKHHPCPTTGSGKAQKNSSGY